MVKAGRVSIVPKDEFKMGEDYIRLDMVTYNDSLYLAKKDNVDVLPTDDEYWMLLVKKVSTASEGNLGMVKADGITINIAKDGTISATIDTQKINFDEASSRNNINSGENLPTLMGKIKKIITDLKPVSFSNKYGDLDDTPESLKNPNALSFTGGANGSYDGSSPKSIRIPNSPEDVGADASGSANAALVDAKSYTDTALNTAKGYTDTKIDNLINGASSAMDTLKEVEDALKQHKEVADALNEAIGTKASQSEFNTHKNDTTSHITATERTNWNDANTKKHNHDNKSVLDGITSALINTWNTVSNKVDKVTGKQLSTEDYTTAEKNKLNNLHTVATSGDYDDLTDKRGNYYGTCTTAADAKNKVVTVSSDQNFKLVVGCVVGVKFTNSNTYSATADSPVTLNVNNTGAKNIYYNNTPNTTGTSTIAFGTANRYNYYMYDGNYWVFMGQSYDANTTYSAMSTSELTTGTVTTTRVVRADYLKAGIESLAKALDPVAASATPKAAASTAGVGTSDKYAREDHVHPVQTSVSGNAGTATKLAATKNIDGFAFDGSGNIHHYGTCTTAAATAAKVANVSGNFTLAEGAFVLIKMTNANTVASPTLNVNSTGAKSIMRYGSTTPGTSATTSWQTGSVVLLVYDGTNWQLVGWLNDNTTYSVMSESELTTGTATTSRVVRADYLKSAIGTIAKSVISAALGGDDLTEISEADIKAIVAGTYNG